MGEGPEYGPGGYLPDRAARRARKIILREQLGLRWVIASIVAGAVLLVVAVLYFLLAAGPPRAPFEPVVDIDAVDARGSATVAVSGQEVLVVRGGGGVRVFAAPEVAAGWCAASGRIEAADGRVWDLSGRLRDGEGAGLPRLPAEVHDGVLYVDPRSPTDDRPTSAGGGEDPVCAPAELR